MAEPFLTVFQSMKIESDTWQKKPTQIDKA